MPNSRATMETIGAPAGGPHGAGNMNFRAILSSRVHMWRMGKSVVNKTNEAMTATAAVTWSAGEHRVPAHSTTLINQVPGSLRLLQTCAQHAEGENTARRSNKPAGPAWPMPPKYGAKTAHEFKHLIPVWSKPDARISSALRVAVSLKAEGRGVRDRRGDETRRLSSLTMLRNILPAGPRGSRERTRSRERAGSGSPLPRRAAYSEYIQP